jgi:hypothetical protein
LQSRYDMLTAQKEIGHELKKIKPAIDVTHAAA